jgi:CPA2 family monovalent cation:H+ antiporter-2
VDASLPILEIGAVLLAAAAAGWIARRLTLPSVIGYLAVGLIVSPFTPGYVANREQLDLLANVGVVVLLFEVGIEVDIWRLRREHSGLLLAAPVQTILTTLIAGAAIHLAGLPLPVAAVVGLCVALSSSVVIVNITRSHRRSTDRRTETALLGWSVLQDVTGVALAAILLAFVEAESRTPVGVVAGLVAFVVIAVGAAAVLPWVLRHLRGEADLFLIVSIAAGLTIAGVGAVVFGIPLALGAFVGGLVIAETHDAAEARRRLRPFRDVFAVLFFVAVGTLLDPGALDGGLGWLALIIALLLVAKVGVAWLLGHLIGLGRPGQVAIGLGQLGEFSFVLVSLLFAAEQITPELNAALLASVVLSIALSAVLVRAPVPSWRRGESQAVTEAASPG